MYPKIAVAGAAAKLCQWDKAMTHELLNVFCKRSTTFDVVNG